jgi:glycosyltransferase involved in cell wall biosynthesis
MSGTPAVSVLMTAYNREPYIAAAIESVLAQEFADFELVVVDDASGDRTVEIARQYAARDARVRVIVNERNVGDYPNRNHALTFARGRFVKYHDSDDVMYPHCLRLMVGLLDAEPRAAFGLSMSRAWPGGPVPMLLSPRQSYLREFLGFGMFMGGPACALFRTDLLRGMGGFPEQGAPSDHFFWLDACARHHVLLLPADLFWYRTHGGQELQSARAARDYARVPGRVWETLSRADCPLQGDELQRARRNQAWTVARLTWRDLRAGRFGLAVFRLRASRMRVSDWLRYLRRPVRHASAGVPLAEGGEPDVPSWARAAVPPEP